MRRGYVSSTPAGLACDGGGICVWHFPTGSKVLIRASHDSVSLFSGWSGSCSGTSAMCVMTIGAGSMNIVATFRANGAGVVSTNTNVAATNESSQNTMAIAPITTGDVGDSNDNNASSQVSSDVPSSSGQDATISSNASSSESSGDQESMPSSNVGHVVIAAVEIAGAASTDDFVRLANPTANVIDVSGWKLHKKSSTGADYSLKVFPSGSTMAAGGTFTWACSTNGFSDAIGADVASTQSLAADNSVALFDTTGNIVDSVAWGTGSGQYGEGPPYATDPTASHVLTRRSSGGVLVDTDNNANDFAIE